MGSDIPENTAVLKNNIYIIFKIFQGDFLLNKLF